MPTMLKNKNNLTNYYCCLRVGKRNKALRRMYYRKIEKEKLKLAELNECQECLRIYCRYLATLKNLAECSLCASGQMQINFT